MDLTELRPWLTPALIASASAAAGYLFSSVILRRLAALFEHSELKLGELVTAALERHIPWWFVLAGASAAAQSSPLSARPLALVHKATISLFFLSAAMAASRLLSSACRLYARKFTTSAAMTRLIENLARAGIAVMGAMLVLSNLGVSITPVLTALGVGSLAVALALQDTLTNLFAGMHLVLSGVVDVGDYIKLDSGQEGRVAEVGWRLTRLLDPNGNTVLAPNAKVANSILVNFNQPEPETAVAVPLAAAFDADLKKVERAALETAAEVQKSVGGAAPGFEPVVRFTGFGDYAIQFSAVLKAKTCQDRAPLVHEFLKRLRARYEKEGIRFPERPGGPPPRPAS